MAVRQITTKFALDGEQEFKRQLSAVNRELGNLGQEMKLVDAQFKGQANSAAALREKQRLLAEELANNENKVKSLEDALKKTTEAYGEGDKRVDGYRKSLLIAKRQLIESNQALEETSKYLKEAEESADGCATSIDGFGKAVKDAGDEASGLSDPISQIKDALSGLRNEDGSFNLSNVTTVIGNLKGLLIGGAIVGGAKALKDAVFEVVESTEEYRKVMGTLEVSSAAAGYSAEETAQIYQELQSVLGDTQTAATVTANLQAIGLAQEDLKVLVDEMVGAWATYGDSIPIDSLSEAVNETIQVGKVTGVFADALNWAGVNEDAFNAQLEACIDTAERAQLVLAQLANQGLRETGQAWKEANQDIVEMNKSQERLNASMAELGEMLTPFAADWNNFKASAIDAIVAVIETIGRLVDKLKELKLNGNPQRDLSSENAAAYDQYLKDFARGYNGSHAAGLDRVPYDGYIAELHADEAVLNAQEAALWRSAARASTRTAPAVSLAAPAPAPAAAQSAPQRESLTLDVTLELDGATLARKQYTYNQAEAARRGTSRAGKAGSP